MRAYTSLEQSKKLAKFLPIVSADMWYGYIAPYEFSDRMYDGGYDEVPYSKDFLKKNPNFSENEYDGELPCWSLAALLNYLREIDFFPSIEADEHSVTMSVCYYDEDEGELLNPVHDINVEAETFIDACYELLLKLKEQNII